MKLTRRQRRELARRQKKQIVEEKPSLIITEQSTTAKTNKIQAFFDRNYKKLLIIPLVLLLSSELNFA